MSRGRKRTINQDVYDNMDLMEDVQQIYIIIGMLAIILIIVGFIVSLDCCDDPQVDIVVADKEIIPGFGFGNSGYYLRTDTGDYYSVRSLSELNQFDIGRQYTVTVRAGLVRSATPL